MDIKLHQPQQNLLAAFETHCYDISENVYISFRIHRLYFMSSDSKEIDPNDVNFEKITGSLTRKQAEAVKKRIDTLNQSTKKKLGLHVPPSKQSVSSYPTDVRTIFPVKTNGQPSNAAEQIHTARPALRKSYSEGVHVVNQASLQIAGMENEVGHSCRHYHSAGVLSSPADKESAGVYLHPDCALERRASDEMQLRKGELT